VELNLLFPIRLHKDFNFKATLNFIHKFKSYLKKHTIFYYKDQILKLHGEIITVYSENQNTEI